jgi:hypothetical protein
LRALLAHAGVAGVKGDPTMLWRCIAAMIPAQRVYTIDSAVTLSVAPGGTANPSNPFGGDPFDNLASAMAWLGYYSITSRGSVSINVAAGTYTHTTALNLWHADGARIQILGQTDPSAVVLSFPSGTDGVQVHGPLFISNMVLVGSNTGTGLLVDGGQLNSFVLAVQNWGVGVTLRGGGYLNLLQLGVAQCSGGGVLCQLGGNLNCSDQFTCSQIAEAGGAGQVAALNLTVGGRASVGKLVASSVNKGICVTGTGSELWVTEIHVSQCASATAVEANNGGTIIGRGAPAGAWSASNTGSPVLYFYAATYGFIRADNSFLAANLANCSPAANTVGNEQALVKAF